MRDTEQCSTGNTTVSREEMARRNPCLISALMAGYLDGPLLLGRHSIPSPVLVVPPECVQTSVLCPDLATLPM